MTTYPKVLARGEESGGRVAVVESVMGAGATGPPIGERE
jgi:hypothetical protein